MADCAATDCVWLTFRCLSVCLIVTHLDDEPLMILLPAAARPLSHALTHWWCFSMLVAESKAMATCDACTVRPTWMSHTHTQSVADKLWPNDRANSIISEHRLAASVDDDWPFAQCDPRVTAHEMRWMLSPHLCFFLHLNWLGLLLLLPPPVVALYF